MAQKQFKTESKRILDLMINSIYTHKEIFLRELISNASDAIDKYYFTNQGHVNSDELEIRIDLDEENRKITISDTGIGMDETDLDENLGTIAQSGSLAFKEEMAKEDKKEEDIDIIGQFGVGFYSAFMVSKEITVISKKEGCPAYKWTSDGVSGYEISEGERENHGTTIILTLKEDSDEEDYSQYLKTYKIKDLVKKYSDYIRYPIHMNVETTKVKEGSEDKDNPEYETVIEEQTLNSMVPLWKRAKSQITQEEYNQFYKDHFYDYSDPFRTIHFNVEGNVSFNALLYIPSRVPQGFYNADYKRGLQLYCRGVFIMDHAEDLLPDYLRFVKGLVDSQDLSLNISRELLQHDHQLKIIASRIEKKVLSELTNLLTKEREEYEKFWNNFGINLKFGCYNNYGRDKDKLQDLLLFNSSKENKLVTLNEYVQRMKEDQKDIYYVSGSDVNLIDKLPVVQTLKSKGFEVLYLTDNVDEFVMQSLMTYREKGFKNAAQGDLDIDSQEEKDELNKTKEENKELLDFMKDSLEEVSEVRLSSKLIDDPVCLTAGEGISFEMERVFNNMPDNPMPMKADRILEINPKHPIFERLKDLYTDDKDKVKEVAEVLYDQACLIEGFPIKDPIAYSRKICELLVK
ncbi:MAG: molecular chaperone HtpG [Floccifex porci]|uniref:molecular chaperone HtpG n=1 Tax=Floccifex porci TaxID=2606629 RepID=UPI0023F4A952|nr:molecular chaperone HtpG [Floccifex porci]MCI7802855.1 molecular chaperone HtpG [Erysipelotrichaceae bacterium]MDD7467456.1 molecular chaperone HtpG [Floccifex porci]MDY4796330.1 molecular chaperone HtpG [Floccifex porci]